MGWDEKRTAFELEYRIQDKLGGYEPQMLCEVRGKEVWVALTAKGYIADQELWSVGSSGEISVHVVLETREDAERAILRARIINEQQTIQAVT